MYVLIVRPLVVMCPKHLFVSHRTHNDIVDAQRSLFTALMCVRVEHVYRIIPSDCRRAVVEDNFERVLRRNRGSSSCSTMTSQGGRATVGSQISALTAFPVGF